MLVFIGVLMLIGVVVVHELGHFIAAKRSGVVVEEFGIGFPPRAKVLGKKNGTTYTLNWLPLGGFVKLKGEHDADKSPGSFGAASLKNKIKIMVAGVVVNVLVAVFLFSVIAIFGMPKILENQFTVSSDSKIVTQEVIASYVAPDSPASSAGLEQGDQLLEIRTPQQVYKLTSANNLSRVTKELSSQKIEIVVRRNNFEQVLSTTLRGQQEIQQSIEKGQQKGYLGVAPVEYIEQRSTWSAPIVGTVFAGQVVRESFSVFGQIIGDLFHGDTSTAKDNVVGVVGIGSALNQLSEQGFKSVLLLVALISLSLAMMNILPIPALDGGRLFVLLLFKTFNKTLTKKAEERIHGTGFLLLMVLFVLVTIVDVQRIL